MKRTKNYILILLIFLSFGCNDFLEETSGDLLIPTKVDEFAPLLYKEGYPCKFNREAGWFKLMTDDVEMSYLEKSSSSSSDNSIDFDLLNGGEGKYAFTWDYNMEEYITDAFWTARYNNILGCNAIIQALPKMKYNEDEKGKYMYLAAQAYALRAYHYFCLINTYALPYSTEHLQSPGVIIRTSPEINIEPQKRASIEEVWTLINSDIKSAIEYMEKSIPSTNPHLLSPAAIWLLASRIALFQEKWDKVIEYGKMFLSETNFIFDLNNVDEDKMGKSSPDDFFIMNIETNNEIIFTFGDGNQYYEYLSMPTSLYNLGFRVSYQSETSLLKMYDESDLRLKAYFMQDYIEKSSFPWIPDEKKYCYHYPIKFKSSKKGYFENWRTVEVFLNLSEAYARNQKEISNEALDLINQFIVVR